ncbi:MAG: hypothetical protein ACFFBP_09825 [Promethearchaeota archaeon]
MEFYKIKNNGLLLSNKLFQEDIVFIIDGIAGYIWKGTNAIEMDEITAKEVEKIIDEKFKGMSFNLITDLDIKKTDNLKIAQIKKEILNRLPRSFIEKRRKNLSSFKIKLTKNYEQLKGYDISIELQKKLSTRLTLWKLAILNCLIAAISIIFMLDLTFIHLLNNDFTLFLVFICLIIIVSINLLFIIFPMKFPKTFFIQADKSKDSL